MNAPALHIAASPATPLDWTDTARPALVALYALSLLDIPHGPDWHVNDQVQGVLSDARGRLRDLCDDARDMAVAALTPPQPAHAGDEATYEALWTAWEAEREAAEGRVERVTRAAARVGRAEMREASDA